MYYKNYNRFFGGFKIFFGYIYYMDILDQGLV